jgi:hypothetical protein
MVELRLSRYNGNRLYALGNLSAVSYLLLPVYGEQLSTEINISGRTTIELISSQRLRPVGLRHL